MIIIVVIVVVVIIIIIIVAIIVTIVVIIAEPPRSPAGGSKTFGDLLGPPRGRVRSPAEVPTACVPTLSVTFWGPHAAVLGHRPEVTTHSLSPKTFGDLLGPPRSRFRSPDETGMVDSIC